MKNYFKIALVSLGLLSMFSCSDDEKTNELPSAAVLTAPANKATNTELKPTFTWDKSIDPEQGAITYDLYVGESNELMKDNIKSKELTATTYTLANALKGNTKYFWKVVATDIEGATATSEVWSFTTKNSAPAVSGLDFPANEATDVASTVTLKWSANDADGDALKYTVYVGTAKELTDADIKKADVTENQLEVTLKGHTKYFWKIAATDAQGAKVESAVASFTTANNAPTKAVLTAPKNKAEKLTPGETSLTWTASTDADGDTFTYTVYVGRTKDINTNFPFKKDITTTNAKFNAKGNATYFWRVDTKDSEGAITVGDVFSFSTANTPPTAAVLNEKVAQTVKDDKVNATFKWTPSTDPDRIKDADGKLQNEVLTYDLYVSTDANFEDADKKVSDIANVESGDVSATVEGLEFKTAYKVKVVTKDQSGATVDSNVLDFTTREKGGGIVTGTWTDTRDGKVYKTVTIGKQTWLAENFAYLPFFEDSADAKIQCSVYGVAAGTSIADAKATENYKKYGVLYSAYAFAKIVPTGWHVPTDDEWKELEMACGMPESETGYSNWRGDDIDIANKFYMIGEKSTPEATNEFKFNLVNGGYYGKKSKYSSTFMDKGMGAYIYFWTNNLTTFFGSTQCQTRYFSATHKGIGRKKYDIRHRMYIRLVKD